VNALWSVILILYGQWDGVEIMPVGRTGVQMPI
jgi:hypothetical protein